MEHTDRAAVVPVTFPWSDVGAWSALWDFGDKDEAGNVLIGEAIVENAKNSYLRSEGQLVTAVGGGPHHRRNAGRGSRYDETQ
jgi:mannose-1-phosphate guanylyltransferase / mannose-6-phosphate isomerase